MKRTQPVPVDPYIEYSFEKDLRNYEKKPTKKVKLDPVSDSSSVRSANSSNFAARMHQEMKEKQRRRMMQVGKSKAAVEMTQPNDTRQTIEEQDEQMSRAHKSFSEQSQEMQLEQSERGNIKQQMAPASIESGHFEIGDCQQACASASPVFIQTVQQVEENSQEKEEENFHVKEEGKDDIYGGRVEIHTNVFVSKRSLDRILRSSKTVDKSVDRLLEIHPYLSKEKLAICGQLERYTREQ